jgi:hypothetical protein
MVSVDTRKPRPDMMEDTYIPGAIDRYAAALRAAGYETTLANRQIEIPPANVTDGEKLKGVIVTVKEIHARKFGSPFGKKQS